MSFGFIRRASPAAKSAARTTANAHRLKNLSIHEVSSVDHGANPGAVVAFFKQAEKEDPMEQITKAFNSGGGNLIAACAQACEFAKRNEISSATFNEIYQHAAVSMFPQAKSIGAAMAAFEKTVIGAEMLRVHCAMPTAAEAGLMKLLDPESIGYDA